MFTSFLRGQSRIHVPEACETSVTSCGEEIKKLSISQEDSRGYITVVFLKFQDTKREAAVFSFFVQTLIMVDSWCTRRHTHTRHRPANKKLCCGLCLVVDHCNPQRSVTHTPER